MNLIAHRLTKLIALTLAVAFQQSSSHAAALRTVAVSGQQATDTSNGVTYDSFGSYYDGNSIPVFRGPVLNNAGQTAFRANLSGTGVGSTNNQGIWSEGSGSLALVARTGIPAPGGLTFGTIAGQELFSPVLNNAGQTAFFGGLSNGNMGLWSEGSGDLALVGRDGTPAPGTSSGVNFDFTGLGSLHKDLPKLNDSGQIAFLGGLAGSGVNSTNNWGVWSQGPPGSLKLMARAGSHAPGTPSGVNYSGSAFSAGFNDAGQVAIWSSVTRSALNDVDGYGIWTDTPGSLTLVTLSGDHAPGTTNGVNFGALFSPVAYNKWGTIAFESSLTGNVDNTNDEGIWSTVYGTLELVARRGSQAAGTPAGVNYDLFSSSSWPLLNDDDQIAFLAGLAGAGVDETNNEGIWLEDSRTQALVARRSNQAPGTPSGVIFSDLYNPALNSAGQIAFRADLTGSGVDNTNDRGIWATDRTGTLQLISRTGELLEVAPGDFRTLSDLDFVSVTGNGDGRPSGFNNWGQLVFWASFTDGSQGVFVSSSVAHLPGDFNNDGIVDTSDYVAWRKNPGNYGGDPDGFDAWRANFGEPSAGAGAAAESSHATVPEPATLVLLTFAATPVYRRRRRAA